MKKTTILALDETAVRFLQSTQNEGCIPIADWAMRWRAVVSFGDF
jgi:hypothetical protein